MPRNVSGGCVIRRLLMHLKYKTVLGTSQAHRDARFQMTMDLDESTLPSLLDQDNEAGERPLH